MALLLAGGTSLAGTAGLPAEAQLVLVSAAFVCMAVATRLVTPLALVGSVLAVLVLDPFIGPSAEEAEWIVLALVFVCALPAAVYDLRALRRAAH